MVRPPLEWDKNIAIVVFMRKEIISTCEHLLENLCDAVFFPSDSSGIQNFSPDCNLIQTKSFLGDITRDDTFCFLLDH